MAVVAGGGDDSSSAEPPPSAPIETPELKAAWLGDSYTAGTGTAGNARLSFPMLVSDNLCWSSVTFGQGGTGYVSPGQPDERESKYGDRLGVVVEKKPNMVIVQGSINDNAADVRAEAGRVFKELQAQLPDAAVIAVGPGDPPKVNPARAVALRDAVRDAATQNDVQFIDTMGWLTVDQYGPDGAHPNIAGHKEIADRLTEALASRSACAV